MDVQAKHGWRMAGTTESCFLFGEAHQDHYRESQGAVVALFSARVRAWALLASHGVLCHAQHVSCIDNQCT